MLAPQLPGAYAVCASESGMRRRVSAALWTPLTLAALALVPDAASAQTAAIEAPTTFASAPPPTATQPSPTFATAPAGPVLPTFAQAPSSDPWSGLTIGGGLSVVSGGRGHGGIGGDAYLGYDKELSNHLVIGVQAVSGYAPSLFTSRTKGFDYGGINVKVGYDMGRLEPYLMAGVGVAKANFGAPGRYNTADSLDSLLNKGGGPTLTTTTVGAGFNYAVTNNFSMGLSVSAVRTDWSAGSLSRPDAP
jgi:opacity protein-like surface antigen